MSPGNAKRPNLLTRFRWGSRLNRCMTISQLDRAKEIAGQALKAFDNLNGPQPGYRPVHAKGILLTGSFTPSASATGLTRAAHVQRPSTPVTVRFSDFAGIPTVADNDPNASPRGVAIRFHLAEHVHTDIIGHSVDGFPVRTPEEFVEFLQALYESARGGPKPTAVERFLASHPAALVFVQMPKPMPKSFATESFFSVSAVRFTNAGGVARYGRYRVRPDEGAQFLDPAAEAKADRNYLFDEIRARLSQGPVKMQIAVQLALSGDVVDDATIHWPNDRPEIALGTVEIDGLAPDNDAEQRHIIFDPIPRLDGIDPSGDPLFEVRSTVYLMSGRRRRAAGPKQKT
jgi:catalase